MSAAAPLELRPPFSFTFHAIERFTARVWPAIGKGRPCADAREALSILIDASGRAWLSPRRTDRGHAVWVIDDPAMRWITRPGTFRGRQVAVVVTVLDGGADAEAEEQAERDVIDAARRLAAVPEVGAEETTSPPPGELEGFALKAYRAWIALETQRLAVERDRLRAIIASRSQPPLRRDPMAERTDRIRLWREAHEAEAIARDRAKTERHHMSLTRDKMLIATAERLAEVDPVGSAELLERVSAFNCMKRKDDGGT